LIFEKQFHAIVSFGAVKEAVRLAKKYFRGKLLPSSAEELLKDALAEAARRGDKVLDVADVVRAAERKTNVPIHEAGAEEAQKLLNLEAVIHEHFIDQEEAVKAVANALREYRSGLSRKGGPIATFLFVGPTGVGKTELSKIISRIQFGSENAIVRFDMSEYQDKQSFFRFIGSPDGKVSGALTDAVLKKPYSLVLLDEFEKAYPDILDLFLPLFDEGRLTDNLERVVDFTNTIIIATSNAHSDIIVEALRKGESMTQIAEYLKRRLVEIFRPELLNRFSRVIVFRNLEPQELVKVAELNLADVIHALDEQAITLTFEPEAVKKIASLGYDPAFGARPLRQVIEEKIRSPLAQKILKKEIQRGMNVRVALRGEEFTFVASEARG
jgi:ATP-dependent Clp protease ATP-binding subunit ClpE